MIHTPNSIFRGYKNLTRRAVPTTTCYRDLIPPSTISTPCCRIDASHNKESTSHENDEKEKSILDLFKPANAEWVKREVGAPPLDISGMAYLLYGVESFDKRHQIESIRRTLEAMVKDGQLDKITSYEQRQDTTQPSSGRGVWCNVSRYGLPGKCTVTRDTGGKQDSIDGECKLVE